MHSCILSKVILTAGAVVASISCSKDDLKAEIENAANIAAQQCAIMDSWLGDGEMPRTVKDTILKKSDITYWCSGFFPGTCWYAYELTGREDVMNLAIKHTAKLLDVDSYYRDHDIGFQVMSSVGLAYKITGDTLYLPTIKRAAECLASRFSPVTGTIRSWDTPNFAYPVIIDNMMNLELLTYAADLFGESSWLEIARSHANTTLKNHFRPNYSSFHLVDYNPENGSVLKRVTVQGYADDSAWSRGQSWGLYGYTMMYRETGDETYLAQAENVASYLLPLLEKRPIPVWDFNSPEELASNDDVSAGAVMASAFLELSDLTHDAAKAEQYMAMARKMIKIMCGEHYMYNPGEAYGFILKHGTGFLLKNREVDAPLTYADYYFLEAMTRYMRR